MKDRSDGWGMGVIDEYELLFFFSDLVGLGWVGLTSLGFVLGFNVAM